MKGGENALLKHNADEEPGSADVPVGIVQKSGPGATRCFVG